MPVTNTSFDGHTTGDNIVGSFTNRVKGKVILITGANANGIGGATVVSLAIANPKLLIIAGRSQQKLGETSAAIQKANPNVAIKPLTLDLSSQQACRTAAQEILEDSSIPQIDILINNAGVMDIAERTLSVDGIEMQFATNHIGHFLFTNLILPKILTAAQSSPRGSTRIINLASTGYTFNAVRFSDWNFTKKEGSLPKSEHLAEFVRDMRNQHEDLAYIPQAAYGQSKTANLLFTVELNRQLYEKYGIVSSAIQPGMVASELGRHWDQEDLKKTLDMTTKHSPSVHLKSIEEGCATTLVAALDPEVSPEDVFFDDCKPVKQVADYASSLENADKLWILSEGLVRQQFRH